ncbi:ABC transporter permease [Microbacterium caowuchunii]|uniref:FtsX-like permease family protein n=1 Tax=Microbacterium caowuchunii TaxID=2614638 RepID=A0A5N0T6X0_9MICO|nr:ABC transporter permease [Microbacterium caowuchunii]KAA9130224.1 FtsX-like permease family protein [Microbacterium caowuchunii]
MGALRLLIFGTRGNWVRLAGIVAGVAIGVLLALLLVAGANALETRDIRSSWLQPAVNELSTATTDDTIAARSDDIFVGEKIDRLDIAAPAHAGAVLPDMEAPTPGTFMASPALTEIITGAPAAQLQERYGEQVGIIPESLLASPDSLVVVVGGTPEEVSALSSAGVVDSLDRRAYGGNQNYQTLALVGALAILIPAFLLVAVSTTLGSAARAERWQTLRTIGASRKLVQRVALAEAAGTAILGAALGVGGFFALRPLLAFLPVAGERLVANDLAVSSTVIVIVTVAVVIGAVLAGARSSRRTGSSATSQTVFEETPSFARVIPLLAGLGLFLLVNSFAGQIPVPLAVPIVASFALIAIGLLIAGPYFTWLTGTWFARLAQTGSAVIASRRIVRTPRAGFRSVAGLVAATFVITVFAFSSSAGVSARAFISDPLLPQDAIAANVSRGADIAASSVENHLSGVSGITSVHFTYTNGEGVYIAGDDAQILTSDAFAGDIGELVGGIYSLTPSGPALLETTVSSLDGMRISDIVVRTDGRASSIEETRTALLTLEGVDHSAGVWTRAEVVAEPDTDLATQFTEIGRLAIVIVTLLAAAALAMATIAALYERKRTFSSLHLLGMPRNTLTKVVAWETLVPLLSILAPTVILGWFTAYMLITNLSERSLSWPDSLLVVALAATGLMVAASVVLAARVGNAITRSPESTRRE